MIENNIPFPPNIPQSETSEPEFLSQQFSLHQATQELHQGGMPSPTPSAPQELVRNYPGNKLPATEPAQEFNNNSRQLPLTQSLTQPTYQPTTQPTQQRPGPHEEPIGTPQATDWYGCGTGNNFRTRNGDRGNTRNNQTDFQDYYDRNENFGNPRQGNRSDDEQGYGNSLATLEKMYKEDYKYNGQNDNFDHKLGIFYEICMKANVPPRYRNAAYSTMLRRAALDHYHTNLRQHTQTAQLDNLTRVTRQYFESKEYQRGVIDRWTDITLESVMDKPKNAGKSTTDCLQLLLTEMRHLKLGLPPEMKADVVFHSKLLHACRDLPACVYACCKPADDISSLINELETSITTYERQQKRGANSMFTDRRYHPQKYSYPPRKQTPFRRNNYQEPPRTTTSRRPFDKYTTHNRKYFICDRTGCWSTKHSRKERDEFRRRRNQEHRQYLIDDDDAIPDYHPEDYPDNSYPENTEEYPEDTLQGLTIDEDQQAF
jgi:hypothetical protein